MALTTDRRRLATSLLAVGLVGCGADGESVPVPGADAVVTAPVATIDRPSTSTSAPTTTPATVDVSTSDPSTSDPSASDPAVTAAGAPSTTAVPPEVTTAPPVTETPGVPPADDVFLRLGDEGPEVASMQAKLASIDYLSSDFQSGVYDEATRRGVRRFQGDYGLGVDGIFGPITLRALNAAVSSINAGS